MLLVAAAQAGDAPSSTRPYAGRVGLNTHQVWVSQADAQATFATARSGGVAWVREDFDWSLVEPQRGSFSWARTDAVMTSASLAGVDVLGILDYSAPWASSDPSGRGDTKYPPRSNGDYARYAAAVVARYGPGGSFWSSRPDLSPRPLTAVQIWNEPWGYWFWKPDPSPAAYAALARAAIGAIRAVNPRVKILIAGDLLQVRTDRRIVGWLESLRAADPGLAGLADAYAVHPYPYPRTLGPYDERIDPRWDFRRVTLIHQIDPSLPIWITEVGWSTASTSDSVTEATQAAYVRGAIERALGEWGSYVERIFVYSYDRDSGNTADREGYYGLRRQDGSPKPAWSALTTLIAAPAADAEPAPLTVKTAKLVGRRRLSGRVVWEAVPAGAEIKQVDFAIDGARRWTERVAPYRYLGDTARLDTRTLANGRHRLTVTAVAVDGRSAAATVRVVVQNKTRRTK
jgi:hypothetical protein